MAYSELRFTIIVGILDSIVHREMISHITLSPCMFNSVFQDTAR